MFFSVQKYPIVWQGLLALKNDQAAVQLHFVSGNTILAQRSLPPPEGGPLLRIVQRMRLEASQLDSVARRMTVSVFTSSEKQVLKHIKRDELNGGLITNTWI